MATRYLKTAQAAAELGISATTLQRYTSEGHASPAWRTPGGQARWDIDDLRHQLGIPVQIDAPAPVVPSVVAAVVTSTAGVLIGRRNDGNPLWSFIAGEVEPGETPGEAAVREVKEETGLDVTVSSDVGDDGVLGSRMHPLTNRHLIYVAAAPTEGHGESLVIVVGDQDDLAEVRWLTFEEADRLLPGMFPAARDHLHRVISE